MTLIDPDSKEESAKTNDKQQTSEASQWGYDLYPDRRHQQKTAGFFTGKGRENIEKIKCERSVYQCIKESPLIKLMMGALRASGCPIDIRRHISCEECAPTVSGGYDPIMNQIVICQNTVTKTSLIHAVLTHEFVHMFDFCKNDLDFKNLDHLACTEVRAANLAHCSFVSAMLSGDASPINIKQAHQFCVKNKALSSILAARNVTESEAIAAINRVFTKCYADLEPIGRRIRRNSNDMSMAYEEGVYYGYG
ncbi:unnamed protein product [Phyllotreta striolata]|uniref:Mitochondrial inner membrane protease ATP23 n=1 Tax=Phyllotreta striolata TaxID=444603 RepID=A0A9N9TZC0_PHYSR|nr:unnamed protein product [Phyllotreta striolata]